MKKLNIIMGSGSQQYSNGVFKVLSINKFKAFVRLQKKAIEEFRLFDFEMVNDEIKLSKDFPIDPYHLEELKSKGIRFKAVDQVKETGGPAYLLIVTGNKLEKMNHLSELIQTLQNTQLNITQDAISKRAKQVVV